jgi:hypothetical protein
MAIVTKVAENNIVANNTFKTTKLTATWMLAEKIW